MPDEKAFDHEYLIPAARVEPRLPRESDREYFYRLERMGYRVAGVSRRFGDVMLAPPFLPGRGN